MEISENVKKVIDDFRSFIAQLQSDKMSYKLSSNITDSIVDENGKHVFFLQTMANAFAVAAMLPCNEHQQFIDLAESKNFWIK